MRGEGSAAFIASQVERDEEIWWFQIENDKLIL